MKFDRINLSAIAVGTDGAVILTDDDLAELAASPGAVDAGGDGQINVSTCTNAGGCNNSQNGHCSNAAGQCEGARNNNSCMIILDPEG